MCGLNRLILPAAMVGVAVATILGSAAAGWLAAAVVAGIIYIAGRRRWSIGSCALPAQKAEPIEGLVRDQADKEGPGL